MADVDSSGPKAQDFPRASEAKQNSDRQTLNTEAEGDGDDGDRNDSGVSRAKARRKIIQPHLRNKKRVHNKAANMRTSRQRRAHSATSSGAFSEDLQKLREVFVSFCKPAAVLGPNFDVKAVASDPLQLDMIKMSGASFAKFSRDCCMVTLAGEGLSLTDVDIIFARQRAKAADRRSINWLQFLECLVPLANKLELSFEEFCSAVVQQSKHQSMMKTNASALRKQLIRQVMSSVTRNSKPKMSPRNTKAKSKKYINKILHSKSRRLSVMEREEDIRTQWLEMDDRLRVRLRQCFCNFCVFAPSRQVLDVSTEPKMTGTAWAKFCRDCKFLGPKLNVQDVDLFFVKNKTKGTRKMTWHQFRDSCLELSIQMDMHLDQFMRAIAMPSLNHSHFDDTLLHSKETLKPHKSPGLRSKPAKTSPVHRGEMELPSQSAHRTTRRAEESLSPEPRPLDFSDPFSLDSGSDREGLYESEDKLELQNEAEEVDTQWLMASLLSVAEDDGMLSAQEMRWVGGYRDFMATMPTKNTEDSLGDGGGAEEEDTEDSDCYHEEGRVAEAEAPAPHGEAVDEENGLEEKISNKLVSEAANTALYPADLTNVAVSVADTGTYTSVRLQHIRERWAMRRDGLLADRAGNNKTPNSASEPKIETETASDAETLSSHRCGAPEPAAKTTELTSSALKMDALATSLFESWEGERGDIERDVAADDVGSPSSRSGRRSFEDDLSLRDMQELAKTVMPPP